MDSQKVKASTVLLRKVLRWALVRSRGLNGCKEVPHVEREIIDAVIVCNCGDRTKVNAFLIGFRRDMCPDLLEKVKDMSATQIRRRRPFLSPRAPQKKTSQEVEVNTVSAETKARLGLRVLYGQIDIPTRLPKFESLNR